MGKLVLCKIQIDSEEALKIIAPQQEKWVAEEQFDNLERKLATNYIPIPNLFSKFFVCYSFMAFLKYEVI